MRSSFATLGHDVGQNGVVGVAIRVRLHGRIVNPIGLGVFDAGLVGCRDIDRRPAGEVLERDPGHFRDGVFTLGLVAGSIVA